MNYYLLERIHKEEEFTHRTMTDKVILSWQKVMYSGKIWPRLKN